MSIVTVAIFLIAALLGLFLISYILTNKNTPKGIAFMHGGIAATGIVLLIIYMFMYSSKPYLALIFFVLAAIGGFIMMYRDITGMDLPKWLPLGHGLIAVVGFVLLLIALFM